MQEDLSGLRDALAARYRLERELGRGGMATVYLATDVRHHRAVALKLLHPELAAAVGPERFLREIEIAAGLTHPHILPVYDSGEAAGRLYLVMPFVEGESLRDRLQREARLPVHAALRIAAEVADALDHAHRHGVVHRDIKPGNILLAGPHAWVADFGVARALAAGAPDLTTSGAAIGTPAYMSPEQASGSSDVDGRSDIYALGCVLFEMLAGGPPFAGPTVQAVLARHMSETAPSLRRVRADVPLAVDLAVGRALALRREDRFATAGDMWDVLVSATPSTGDARGVGDAADAGQEGGDGGRAAPAALGRLRQHPVLAAAAGATVLAALVVGIVAAGAWLSRRAGGSAAAADGGGVAAPAGADRTGGRAADLAVLYFDDLSPARDHGYLAEGFTTDLIRRLGQVEGLRVRSRQSVKPFREASVPMDSLRRALGVDFLVEGNVIPVGEELRVTVGLLDAGTGVQLGSATHSAPAGSVTALLDQVADDVSRFLRRQLGREIRFRELRARTRDDSAWSLVHRAEETRARAMPLLAAGDLEGATAALRRADSLLSRARRRDPRWVDPIVLRGWVARDHGVVAAPTPGRVQGPWARHGIALADSALAIEPDGPDALELRGTLRWDLYRLATDAEADSLLGKARADLERAVAVDPARPSAWKTLSDMLYLAGEAEAAYEAALRAQEEDRFLRDDADILFTLAQTALDLYRYEDALAWAREGRQRWPKDVGFPAIELAVLSSSPAFADVGWAWALADTILAESPPHRRDLFRPLFLSQIAAVLGHAGHRDSAAAVLARAGEALGDDPTRREYAAYDLAHAWLVVGDREESLRWLALDLESNPHKRANRARDPWFAPLYGDPRFQELVETGR